MKPVSIPQAVNVAVPAEVFLFNSALLVEQAIGETLLSPQNMCIVPTGM